MKVHGKDAICQYDSEDSEGEEEASSPSSSLVSGALPGQEWYPCHAPSSLPTPPAENNGHTQVKFEAHHHSIGGLIGNAY